MTNRDPTPDSQVLGRIAMAEAEAALTAAGLAVIWRDPGDPDKLAFGGGAAPVWVIRDPATGNLIATSAAEDLPAALPQPAAGDIMTLLQGPDPVDNLAGLQAAEGRTEPGFLPLVAGLAAATEPVIRDRARQVLAANLLILGLEACSDAAGPLFALPGWRREKLQIMRWWMHDPPADPGRLEAALDLALTDSDWEIAVTAMLAAARLGLTRLAPRLARLRLPEQPRQGVTPTEARLLLALRDLCLTRLGRSAGRAMPPGVTEVLQGDPDQLPPELRDFAAALLLPLAIGTPAPQVPGVLNGPAGPCLPDGRLLCWVPPGRYRLGAALPFRGALANPRHPYAPPQGFFIEAQPRPPATLAAARATAAALSADLARPVVLPAPDQWEAAMRGSDGRRFPWGLNAEAPLDLSPFGLAGFRSGPGEWLDQGVAAAPAWAGGTKSPVPARHFAGTSSDCHAFRTAIMVTS